MSFDRDKFAKVMAMTQSAHDGEKLAALDRANAMLKAAGLQWKNVLAPAAAPVREVYTGYTRHPAQQPDPSPFYSDPGPAKDGGFWKEQTGWKNRHADRAQYEADFSTDSWGQQRGAKWREDMARRQAERDRAAGQRHGTYQAYQAGKPGDGWHFDGERWSKAKPNEWTVKDNEFHGDDWDVFEETVDSTLRQSDVARMRMVVELAQQFDIDALHFDTFAKAHPDLAQWLFDNRKQNVMAHSMVLRILQGEIIDEILLTLMRQARNAQRAGGY